MLINLRNALMAGKRLPYDAEVEWLRNTGKTQYINTGVIGGPGLRIQTRIASFEKLNDKWAIASFGANARIYAVYQYKSGTGGGYWGGGYGTYFSGTNDTTMAALGVFQDLDIQYTNDYQILAIDGIEKARWSKSEHTGASTNPLWLFGQSPYHETSKAFECAIGPTKIWMGGVLVRDFIPVRKGTVGYMYDRVTRKLFRNAGSGDFVLGPDVVPVEWLEGGQSGGGIAFIDTGYTPNSSTKIESTSAILSAWGYSGRFGSQSRLTFGVGNGSLYLAQGNHYYLGGYAAGTFYSFVNDIPNRTVSVEGVGSTSTTAISDWHPQLYPIYLFASNVSPTTGTVVNGKPLDTNSLGRIRMKSCNIWENDIPVRNFRPVRVGTEGALIDTLTRRIYRNQGTGAFTYGNDLKYPIPAE